MHPLAPTFPPEVLEHILSYVDSPYLNRWRHLNSTFLRRYLEDKYSTIKLDMSGDYVKACESSSRIRFLGVGTFVRTIDMECFGPFHPVSEEEAKEFEEMAARITRPTELRCVFFPIFWRNTIYGVHLLLNTSSGSSNPQLLTNSLTQTVIAATAHTLKRISFQLSWLCISEMLGLIHNICGLTHLSIRTCEHENNDWISDFCGDAHVVNNVLTVLGAFVKKHSATLHELELVLLASQGDFTRFYTRLSKLDMPYLRKLKLIVPLTTTAMCDEGAALSHLLLKYGPQLSSLAFFPAEHHDSYTDGVHSQDMYMHIARTFYMNNGGCFPLLRELYLSIYKRVPWEIALSVLPPALYATKNTLTDLRLSGRYLSDSELVGIFLMLDDSLKGGCMQLTRLAIYINCLSPATVDLLAQSLPKLEALHIKIVSLGHDEIINVQVTVPAGKELIRGYSLRKAGFLDAMAKRDYTNWHLTELNVEERGPGRSATGYERLSSSVDSAIARAVPRLGTMRWGHG